MHRFYHKMHEITIIMSDFTFERQLVSDRIHIFCPNVPVFKLRAVSLSSSQVSYALRHSLSFHSQSPSKWHFVWSAPPLRRFNIAKIFFGKTLLSPREEISDVGWSKIIKVKHKFVFIYHIQLLVTRSSARLLNSNTIGVICNYKFENFQFFSLAELLHLGAI